ncbi:MAG: ABC transporter ATP-binding protein [Armatimonadota bacterium]|nr:ABC transporter ATP-binding protein [Armatimonadota bacterium]MDW8156151.1 ABC transporter ATP-binding protein [Armatimonadota bacterium]
MSKRFGGVQAVRELDLEVGEGEIFGLLGPNGSGKTTVFNLVAGVLAPDAGEIRFGGVLLNGLPPHRRAALGVARTFQLVRSLGRLSVADNVAVARLYGATPARSVDAARQEASQLLALVGLAGKAHLPAASLNLAERRRLEVARALATRPRLLLLDEPLAGLNADEVQAEVGLFRRLREEGLTLVLVEHNVPAVRSLCDRVAFLHAGEKVAEGSPEQVLSHPRVVEVYLGGAAG